MIHAAPLFTTSEASLLREELNIFITSPTYLRAQRCLQGSESELKQIKNKDRFIYRPRWTDQPRFTQTNEKYAQNSMSKRGTGSAQQKAMAAIMLLSVH